MLVNAQRGLQDLRDGDREVESQCPDWFAPRIGSLPNVVDCDSLFSFSFRVLTWRLLACRNFRKVAHSLLPSSKIGNSTSNGTHYIVGPADSVFKLLSRNKLLLRDQSSFAVDGAKKILKRGVGSRDYHTVADNFNISYRAHVAWKRLSHLCTFTGPVLPPINRIACAMTFVLSRYNLAAPSLLAFLISKFAWSGQALAEAEFLPPRDALYMHAQNGHIYLTSCVLLLLEALILLFRATYIAVLFLPCIAMAPFVDSLGTQFRKTWLRIVHHTLEKAGPAFIKWGQWASTRPDLFPRDLCSQLAELQTKAPSHSFKVTKRSIENAFGRKLHEIFERIEEEPVASGSVAQVHQAILKYRYPGQPIKPIVVAVKVRHPGVGEAIRRDFMIINFVAKLSRFIPNLKWLRLDESVQQFAVFMMSQVDLSREAAHLSRFNYNFRSWKDVSFPKALYPLVHPSVLVETYEHGESVIHYVDELKGHKQIKSALAHIGTHVLLKMLLVDNFIHADMHPGNILVRARHGKSLQKHLFNSKPHVILLDVGMTAELSKRDRGNLLDFFKAVARRDGRTAAECTLRLSKQQNCPNPMAFIEAVEKDFRLWSSPEADSIHPADCMQMLLEQVRRHRVNMDGNVCTVMVTTLVLEGWQRKLDPDYDVLHTLQNLLFKVDWAESLVYTIEGLMAP